MIGGYRLRSVSTLNLKNNFWDDRRITPLKKERQGASACYLDGHLYVIGGFNSNGAPEMKFLRLNTNAFGRPMWKQIYFPFQVGQFVSLCHFSDHEIAIVGQTSISVIDIRKDSESCKVEFKCTDPSESPIIEAVMLFPGQIIFSKRETNLDSHRIFMWRREQSDVDFLFY